MAYKSLTKKCQKKTTEEELLTAIAISEQSEILAHKIC